MVTSVRSDDSVEDYLTDPNGIQERFGELVDYVIDGGPSRFDPSTVIDCTGDAAIVVREGKGKIVDD